MRVLFTVFALNSHFYNTVPIAWALRAAGHEVCVAAQPDLVESIKRAGLTAVPVGNVLNLMGDADQSPNTGQPGGPRSGEPGYGSGYNIAETRPEKLTWEYVRDTLGTYCVFAEMSADQAALEDLVAFCARWQPDLLVWDAMTYTGPVAARAGGIPHARLLFGTDHWARMRALFHELRAEQPEQEQVDPVADWLNERLASLGHAPAPGAPFDEELVLGQRTIDPLPSWVRVPVEADPIPVRPVIYNGPSAVPAWVHERPERPRVCLTMGLSIPRADTDGFPVSDLLEAAVGLDVELIATVAPEVYASVAAGSVPDNVRLVDFVPLNELLPSCSAIIHHGGMGTMQNALRHGVPQLIVPGWLWDEAGNAESLVDQGAGLVLDPAEFSAERLRSSLTRLLEEPAFDDNAARLQKELLALPSPVDIVPELERLAAERGAARGTSSV
ncbi:activator-dependent family glycosyltransferase [Actinomadura sp. 7K507]|uniref:activator-dependent family glycosyltransferase n=1 Tax=Actinomadura sp. 7K507 TaxID=2530365 RepID=UPI00104BEE79|nr:activator-dependent family glycosyltransferase [Actinomadura sp. 7K507]TDC86368.1 activator-dependent family glycosyltransferase [Actinomadura sp. 7K507]